MRHAYMYNGGFETNYSTLRSGSTTYVGTDGALRALPPWPEPIDGVRVGYMEKAGKKFYAVRVQHGDHDVVLKHPVAIDPLVHMGNQRFSSEPVIVNDDDASTLLDEIIRCNPEEQPELARMINQINQVRRASRGSAE